MTTDVEIANTIVLLVFTAALLTAGLRIWGRIVRYRILSIPVPVILWRDAATITGLAVPFGIIFLVRAMGMTSHVAGQLWWSLLTGVPACVGMGIFWYFEYFVIDDAERATFVNGHVQRVPRPSSSDHPDDGAP